MRKSFTLVMAIMMAVATLMLQGCNNSGAQPTTTSPTPTVTIPVTTIGWGALTPSQREEIIRIGENHPFGGAVKLNPQMDEIVSVILIEDIPSNCQKQALLEYKYSNGAQVGINKILIKGHLENVQKVESIPDLLNNGACCFEYGGCIKTYECNEPLPEQKHCVPCEKVQQSKEDCEPCKHASKVNVAPGPGKKQGDGAVPTSKANGDNHKIITDW